MTGDTSVPFLMFTCQHGYVKPAMQKQPLQSSNSESKDRSPRPRPNYSLLLSELEIQQASSPSVLRVKDGGLAPPLDTAPPRALDADLAACFGLTHWLVLCCKPLDARVGKYT